MRILEMKERLEVYKKRNYDEWGLRVQKHLHECHDLVAAEGCYHKTCYNNFRLQQGAYIREIKSPGIPVDTKKIANFEKLCEWLELEGELRELQDKLIEISQSEDVYDVNWIKNKLMENMAITLYFQL